MKKTLGIIAIALGSVAALGLMAFSYADAAGLDVPALQAFDKPPFEEGEKGALVPYIEEAAAEILGISVEDLQAAREEGVPAADLLEEAGMTPEEFKEALDAMVPEIVEQALDDGAITEEQAGFILENGLRRPRARRGFGPLNPYVLEATADALEMDVDDLKEALQNGTTMNELLDEAGMTHLELRMAIDEATPDIVEQALDDGAITEEQAGKILEYGLRPPRCRRNHPGPNGPGGPQGKGPGGFGPNAGGPGFGSPPPFDG